MTFTLIGMPGAGKSCMGRVASRAMHMGVIDTDRLIETRTGMKLQNILNERGLCEFKKIEEEVLLSIDRDRTIISTGGSAVYSERAMKHLKSLGPVIYLYTSIDTVIKRIGDFSKRGIALAEGQSIEDLYKERAALYEKYADITVNCDGEEYAKYQEAIIKEMKSAIARAEARKRRAQK